MMTYNNFYVNYIFKTQSKLNQRTVYIHVKILLKPKEYY